jgi:hypothetical protein
MIPSRLPRRLLTTLFVRSQNNDCIDLLVLSERAGASPYAVLRALAALEAAGLVDARRLRLTLSGLALASALVGPRAEAPGEAPSEATSPQEAEVAPGEPAASARHAA